MLIINDNKILTDYLTYNRIVVCFNGRGNEH